jgi:DNA-binding transcriptional regulator GbsR (MarR family)
MDFSTKKQQFIASWGVLGQQWGINKAMSQIHALLLISTKPMTMVEIMDELQMSRGNVSMNLRSLMEWGLVEKTTIAGDRKEYFKALKDVMAMTKRIAIERRKREVEPTLKLLQEASEIDANTPEEQEFVLITSQLAMLTQQLDTILGMFAGADEADAEELIGQMLTNA